MLWKEFSCSRERYYVLICLVLFHKPKRTCEELRKFFSNGLGKEYERNEKLSCLTIYPKLNPMLNEMKEKGILRKKDKKYTLSRRTLPKKIYVYYKDEKFKKDDNDIMKEIKRFGIHNYVLLNMYFFELVLFKFGANKAKEMAKEVIFSMRENIKTKKYNVKKYKREINRNIIKSFWSEHQAA